MKKIFVAVCALGLVSFAHAQTAPATPATTNNATTQQQDFSKVIEVTDVDHDLGKIPFGKPVEYEVTLKNISSDSVKLLNVQAGCGCTTPKWEAGPYAPGESFKIKLGFNGMTKGTFSKYVTVFLTNGLSKQLRFHGETFEAPDNAAPANGAVGQLKPSSIMDNVPSTLNEPK